MLPDNSNELKNEERFKQETEGQTWKLKKYGNTFKEPCECVYHCIKECKADTVKVKNFKKEVRGPYSSTILELWSGCTPNQLSHNFWKCDPAISILQNSPRDIKTQPRLRITVLNLKSKKQQQQQQKDECHTVTSFPKCKQFSFKM